MRAGDLLNRDFHAEAPNRVWVADFTYVRTWAGFTYVSFVVDVFAQKIVGWHATTSKPTELAMVPLHSSIGMLTPTEAEEAHYAATTALHPEPQPA